jgi:hypothetical protein
MVEKYEMILDAEEAFARQVALGVIVTTPQSVWSYLIPFMFIFDFLRRGTTIRRFTQHFMFPRKLTIHAAQDILTGEERAKRLSAIGPEIEGWLNPLSLYSTAIYEKQMEVIDLLAEHYLKLLEADGDTYIALIKNSYGNRQKYEAYLSQMATAEEELDRAIIEKLGQNEKLREKLSAERQQVKRLSEKRADLVFSK